MTKALEDTMNLPSLKDILEEALTSNNPSDEVKEIAQKTIPNLDGADHSKAMDDLYKETLEHARNIIDLGFNVPPGMSANIFEQGTSMYKNVIDVANSKRDFQLKAMKFMLEQRKLQLEEQKFQQKQKEEGATTIDGEITLVDDRNEIVKRLRELTKSEEKK